MPAASSRAIASSAPSRPSACATTASVFSRFPVRAVFVANAGSSASSGRSSTCPASRRHSRSFCTDSSTRSPSAVG